MKKRNYLSLLATLAALGIASGMNTHTVQADGGNEADKSLLPVVFLTLDTSGSMYEDVNTTDYNSRFTNAIQELSGKAKVKNDLPYINPNSTRFPRKQLKCNESEDRCAYETVWICGADYPYKNDTSKCHIVSVKEHDKGGSCGSFKCVERSMRNLREGFDGDEASFARQYTNDGLIHQFMNTVKFGIVTMAHDAYSYQPYYKPHTNYYPDNGSNYYGHHVVTVPGFVNGTNGITYEYGFSGLNNPHLGNNYYKIGAWNNEIFLYSPSFYPTTSDDPESVRASNEALIYNIRSFTLRNMGTPLGGMIGALHLMFSNEEKEGKVDPGLILQPKPNGAYLEPAKDEAWECRPKAVIALTDGEPNDTTSQTSANGLYTLGVNVYSIAYGSQNASPIGVLVKTCPSGNESQQSSYCNGNIPSNNLVDIDGLSDGDITDIVNKVMGFSETTRGCKNVKTNINICINPGVIMNKIAWKGGTCHEYGHVGEMIDPDSVEGYKNYLKSYIKEGAPHTRYTNCFYNAYNGMALKTAMTEILSSLLNGYTSKSKMVTTTSVGKLTTVDEDSKPVNGWYNVYSGYRINLGSMRNSALQRETYACRDGEFRYDKSLFLDMGKKLEERLDGCRSESMFSSSDSGPKGNCITNRAIFVGDYSDDEEGFDTGRYALKPRRIHFSETDAGVIHYGNDDDKYQFFAYNDDLYASYVVARDSQINSREYEINEQISKYMISPYECKTEIDCVSKSNFDSDGDEEFVEEQYVCDKGKCVLQNTLAGYSSCTQGITACNTGDVCLSGQCRDMGGGCTHHIDCMSGIVDGSSYTTANQVCHAGSCVNGVLLEGDIRDLIASIPLGAIEYASPVIVGPPSYSYHGSDYVTYKNTYADRDTMLYVPANDGMLHAFILGKNNENKYTESMFSDVNSPAIGKNTAAELEGEELWAFIPKAVMKNIHTLTDFGEQKKINVSPVYADVQFPDGLGGGEWHSVIVGGFREGGRGYYALDVTEPNNPQILWEIDHQWQSVSSNIPYPEIDNEMTLSEAQETILREGGHYPFARMGYSYPEAIITNIIIDDAIVPVAILPGGVASGKPTTDCVTTGANPICFEDVTGKAVYVVRLNPSSKEDLLVREFQFDTRISGTPAAFPAGFNSIARVIYVGDENGALHRIDVSDPDMANWKIDGLDVSTDGKIARPNGTLYPIFDPNNISKMQGTPHKTYEKITYKPAVSALTSTGFPDIQIVFGSGDSSVTSIGPHDLNYTAIAIDHYMGSETGYQLNNFQSDQNLDAYTNNLDPLVIVFNPTSGITSQPLASYDVPNGKKQYFEVWAGNVAPDTGEPTNGEDEPDPDPCDYCTAELCKSESSSCQACPICNCYERDEECDVVVESCKECVSANSAVYQACLENIESSPECSGCQTRCHDVCDVEDGKCVKECEEKEKSRFCTTVCSSTIISALTWLYGGCESECSILWSGITGYLERWQEIYNDPENGTTIDNYCDKEKSKCDQYCKDTGYWQYQSDCLAEVSGCVSACREQEEACDNNCNNRFSTCRSNANVSYNNCRSNAHSYCDSHCGSWFHNTCVWTCENVTRPADCWIAKEAALFTCDLNFAGCRVGCNQYVCDIGCVTDWTWCAVAGCQANCLTDKLDCKIRVEAYKFLDKIRQQFTDSSLECEDKCSGDLVSCYERCNTTCKDPCTCPPQEPCDPSGALTEDECTCDPEYADDEERLMCTDYGFGSGRARAAKRSEPESGIDFDIRASQKMMGPALTYNFKSYFPTYNATLTTGACNDGYASIWMIDRSNPSLHWTVKSASQVQNEKTTGVTGSMDHGKSSTSFVENHYINLANGTKVYGLAMTPQAICVKGNTAKVAAPQLIAQTGGVAGASGASESASNGFTKPSDGVTNKDVTNINVLSITEDAIKAEPDVLSWASVYE